MSKELRIILLSLLGLFIILQLIPQRRPANQPSEFDFFTANEVPEAVEKMIRTSCFDCHSQEVDYPWYSYVAPASWLVIKDVRHGRANLDFSKWNELSKRDKLSALDEIGDEVGHGGMPMPIYTLMHGDAKLTQAERDKIIDWADELAEKVFEE